MCSLKEYELGELLTYEQPTPYIVSSTKYNDSYEIPVLTAGKSFVIGYTNETEGAYDKLPVIIFDDFTTSTQYVNFPFKVKSSAMKILTANTDLVLPKYIFYRMQMIGFDCSTHKRYWIQHYSKIKVKIPEKLEAQEKIVEKIEELFSELDKIVETLQLIKMQLVIYRKTVLNESFKMCDMEVTVNSVCEHVTDGDHMPPPKADKGIPFIMISDINGEKIDWSNTAYVDKKYFESINDKRKPQKGDILYTVTGSFGLPVLVDFEKEFCFQRHIALLRPKEIIDARFLYFAMQTPKVYEQALKGATGTAQKTVGLGTLRNIKIPYVAKIEEQRKILVEVQEKLTLCNNMEKIIDETLQKASAMRQSILRKVFEGTL